MLSITRIRDGVIVDANEGFLGVTEYSRQDLIGKTAAEAGLELDPSWREPFVDFIRGGGHLNHASIRYRTRSGKTRPGFLSTEEIVVEGEPCILCVIDDAEETPQHDHLLDGRGKLFRTLIENSSDGITMIDGTGTLEFVSPSGVTILGTTAERIEGQNVFGFMLEEDRERMRREFAELIKTPNAIQSTTFRFRHNDGTIHWVETVNKNLLHDSAIGAVVCNFRDITQRKRTELEREVIFEIMQGVNTTADINELLALIHRSLQKIVYADNCFISLYNPDDGLFYKAFLVDQYDDDFPPQKLTKSLTAYIFKTGRAASIDLATFQQLVESGEVELVGTNSPSWVGAPLTTPTRTIGVLALQHYEKADVYTQRDVEFLGYVGGQIALAIERKRTEEKLNHSLSLLTATLESTNDGILVVDRNGAIASYNRKFLELWRLPDEIVRSGSDERALHFVLSQLRYPEQFLAKVTELYNSDETSYDEVTFLDGRTYERFSQPQIIDGVIHGRVWSFRDVSEQRRAREIQDAVYHISEASGSAPTVEALFPAVHRIVQSIMPADNFYIALYDAEKEQLHFPYFIDEADASPGTVPLGKGLTAYVIRAGRSVLATDEEQNRLREDGAIEFMGAGSAVWLGVPLKTEKDIIGVMTVQHYHDAAAYTERELRILEFISSQVARAIERKRAEEQIRLLAHAIESTSEAISITGEDGRLIFANQHTLQLYGYAKEELLGSSPEIFTASPGRGDALAAILERARNTSWYGEMIHRRKDGTEFPVIMTVSAMKTDAGRVTGYATVAREITELKHAEEALRQSEERYRILIENVRDAIFRLSPDGIIVSLNAAFTAITGWAVDEWIGRSFTSLIHQDDYPVAVDMFRKVLRGEVPPSVELRVMTRGGEQVIAEITTIPLQQNGKIIGLLGDARDITERKRLEDHLRQSQKMESIGILAGGIAHDFNNILTIILAYASALQQPNLPPEKLNQCVDAIKKTSYRGAELVQQILMFARKTGVSHESVHLNTIVTDLARMLRETFPKTITIETVLGSDLPSVVGDTNQLHQAILNLCVNARDAMPEGGSITFSTKLVDGDRLREQFPDAAAQRYFCLNIADTGTGISESHKAHVFEPFFTTKERGRGTGLGLAVVYGIVRSHNGYINFDSTPGKGTAFSLFFPVAPPIAAAAATDATAIDEIPGGTETILFVEDEEMLLDLLRNLLIAKGYTILSAKDGIEAVEMYRVHQNEIALVLSDVGLPRLSGLEAFQRMKAFNPNVKVMLASGYLDPRMKQQMTEEGARDFVQKPYEPDEILKKVRQVLDA